MRGWQRVWMEEAHGLEHHTVASELQLQMLFADHALRQHVERGGEQRGREALSPHRMVELFGECIAVVGGIEFAVGFDHAFEVGRVDQFAHDHLERPSEFVVAAGGQAEPGRHGVAAKLEDEAGMALVDQVERIAQVQAGDGAAGALEFAIFTVGQHDGGAVEFVFQP
jgi:hypothetical protein